MAALPGRAERLWRGLTHPKAHALKFLLVGVVGFFADAGGYAVATQAWPPAVARVLSIWVAIGVTWALNRRFSFAPPPHKTLWQEYLHYLLSSLCGAAVNYLAFLGILALLPPGRAMQYTAIFVSSALAAGVNFLLYKHMVFTHPKN